jgi:hypothetical protein
MDISMHYDMMWVNLQRQVSGLPKYAAQISLAMYYCIPLAQYYNSTKLETYNLMCEGYKRDRENLFIFKP